MTDTPSFGGEIVWRPTPDTIDRAHLTRFMRAHGIADYTELMARSTADVAWFTDAVLKYLDIRFRVPYDQVVDLSEGIEWPRWCVGGRLNIADNCVDRWANDPAARDRPAVIWEGEEGTTRTLTYAELAAEVNRCANALRSLGIGLGDAVGLFMPMTPEIAVALLALARIGAVALPLFSGYGAGAVASRLADAGAVALFTADGTFRRGRLSPMKPIADEAAAHAPALRHYLIGEANLCAELRSHGLTILEEFADQDDKEVIDPQGVDAVIVAFDRTLDYRKLNTAYQALVRGARFYATNADKTCPMPGGAIPDAGGTLAALEAMTGRRLELLAGKPSTLTMTVALDRLGLPPERCMMVGDRLETDIAMGQQAGMLTAVTLTGVSKREDVAHMVTPPTFVIGNLGEIPALIE